MSVDWFRKPLADDPGTLNACFNALDRHVVRGKAEAFAVELDGRAWTYADLLAEVGAFAGALRAFGVGPGEGVLVGPLPGHHEVVASLAVARLGAVRWYAEASADAVSPVLEEAGALVAVLPTKIDVDLGELPLITVDDSTELSWTTVMRAGRTDPAGCAGVTAPGVLAIVDGESISIITALGASDGQKPPVPPGATLVDVGGLYLWSFDAPARTA
jgi:hypothetical protein